MPHKGKYGVDFDDYEDYDYDYDDGYDVEDNEVPKPKQETSRPTVWRCSICTYDNDESMPMCDICGVIRNPLSGNYSIGEKRVPDGIGKHTGVSIMAKSLFTQLPHRAPDNAVIGQLQNDDIVAEGGNNFLRHGNFRGNFHELLKVFSSKNHSHVNVVPFKFDVPSPDDIVASGLHSSKMGFKVPSGDSEKKDATNTSNIKMSDGISQLSKEQGFNPDESDHSINGVAHAHESSKHKEGLLTTSKGRTKFKKDDNLSKNKPDLKFNKEISDHSRASMLKGKQKIVGGSTSSVNEGNTLGLASNLGNISLTNQSEVPSNINTKRAKPPTQYQPDKWMLPDKAEARLTQLNLAIVGHVDSGKSTLSGRLLHLLGRITQKEMHKYEKEAKVQGKGSFAYAWALDESPEERERGITMTVAVAYFDSKKFHVVVLDSPGHKDFVPNMISGATQADAAILVIDASLGAFEAGMDDSKGQTREHAQLIRSFGVDQIIVAINKMDAVEYSKDRFDMIKGQLGTFLRACSFKDSSVFWIPLSAMENQNLVASPSDVRLSSWYSGPHLLDAIDSFHPPSREFSKPLLMPICDVVKTTSQGQVSASGKLEAGALRSGSKVLVMPFGDVGTVRSVERNSKACDTARAGDNVIVSLLGIDGSHVIAGGVLCHPDFPTTVAKHLELRVLVLEGATPILKGTQLEIHIHHAKAAATVANIISLVDPKTGKVTKKAPRCIISKQNAVLEVVLNEPVCVEEFQSCRALGRAFLRALGRTVALGLVTRIVEDQD
ncbi:hypothetical protein K2173_003514 [Erythroxylum novogranatense]|uniref:Tr-type G domain-containing protein n=1 Tax=Erythroxylum novogranatense TaxID=1862640 RepID=A0AAV8TA98_9ROSI|nr:hypothetical protein K2173_003514 [Erythroxylum novogranatense]